MPKNRKRFLQVAAKGLLMNVPYAFVLVYIYLKELAINKRIHSRVTLSGYALLVADGRKYAQLRC